MKTTTTTMPTTTTTTVAPARRVSAAKPRARATRSTTVARATVDRGDDADRPSGVDAAARARPGDESTTRRVVDARRDVERARERARAREALERAVREKVPFKMKKFTTRAKTRVRY